MSRAIVWRPLKLFLTNVKYFHVYGGTRNKNGGFQFGWLNLLAPWLQPLLITLKYRKYSTVADLHTFHFTAAHAPMFSVFICRLLAMDLNAETITVSLDYTLQISLYYSTHIAFRSRVKSSQADLLHSSMLLVPIRSQLIFTIHAPFSSFYPQLLNPPGLSTLSLSLKNWTLFCL
jgi:hypothetical protein